MSGATNWVQESLQDARLQLDGSVFYMAWQDMQLPIPLTNCGFSFTVNAGAATSKGFDIGMQARCQRALQARRYRGLYRRALRRDRDLEQSGRGFAWRRGWCAAAGRRSVDRIQRGRVRNGGGGCTRDVVCAGYVSQPQSGAILVR